MKGMARPISGDRRAYYHESWIKRRRNYDIKLSNMIDLSREGVNIIKERATLDSRSPKVDLE